MFERRKNLINGYRRSSPQEASGPQPAGDALRRSRGRMKTSGDSVGPCRRAVALSIGILLSFVSAANSQSPVAIGSGVALNRPSSGSAGDESEIMLRKRVLIPNQENGTTFTAAAAGRHVILQFKPGYLSEAVAELKSRGVRILEFVPKYAVSAYVPASTTLEGIRGLRWAGSLDRADKLSGSLTGKQGQLFVVVALYHETHSAQTRERIAQSGGRVIENPYLRPDNLLVLVDAEQLSALTDLDEVSFVFPASTALIQGRPVYFCPGPLTPVGPLADYAKRGEGWDGPGLGSAALTYHFVNGTADVSGTLEFNEVRRALNIWSKYAQITWTETSTANRNRSLDISWVSGDHGDGYPFDGTGKVLAHCFYPSPSNSETIAGDLHFDEAETWRINADVDVFSVALHEGGHGLGLDHSDDPSAVMYAYYSGVVSDLHDDDIAGIRSLYASKDGGSQSNLTPFRPSGWSDKIVVSNRTGTSTDSGSILPNDNLYIDWAVINNGAGNITSDFIIQLYVDNVLRASWSNTPPTNANYYRYIQDYYLGSLSIGSHTLRIKADSGNVIAESNESDNEYTKTITIASPNSDLDFNGDGRSDYALYNAGTQRTVLWYLEDNLFIDSDWGPTLASGWRLVHAADFDGDGGADYLLFQPSTRKTAIWYMSGPTFRAGLYGPTIPSGYEVIGAADFNGDGKPDYILYNARTLRTALWYLDSNVLIGSDWGPTIASGWKLIDAADFDGDGNSDYLLFHPSAGRTAIWYMSGPAFRSALYGPTIARGYEVVGATDFNGDGNPDYVLYDASAQRTALWYLNNNVYSGAKWGPTLPSGYSLAAP